MLARSVRLVFHPITLPVTKKDERLDDHNDIVAAAKRMTTELVDTAENNITIEVFVNNIWHVLICVIIPVLCGEPKVNKVDLFH